MEDNIKVLILGTDINTYYMSRCYHELTGKKADIIGNRAIPYTNISNPIIVNDFNNSQIFIEALTKYGEENKDNNILLIATSDLYVKMVAENKKILEKYFLFNYPDLEIVNRLLIKEVFYDIYKDMGIDMPKTYIYPCMKNSDINEIKKYFNNEYPIIIKPSDGVEYHKLDDAGLAKVYKAHNEIELEKIIKNIENAGYNKNLIIQEFIPGDDSALFDSIFYVGKDKKAKLATFAQIGLQERTPTGIGNCTVLVNGFDEHGYNERIVYKLKEFIEKIGYQGFAEFDMKYDYRDKKYKVLEINPRQSRSGYYLAACGYNLVEYLINDLVLDKKMEFKIIKEKYILSFVPKSVIKKYVSNKELKKEINNLIKNKKIVNPLKYKKDNSIKRRLYLLYRDFNYIKKYKKYNF